MPNVETFALNFEVHEGQDLGAGIRRLISEEYRESFPETATSENLFGALENLRNLEQLVISISEHEAASLVPFQFPPSLRKVEVNTGFNVDISRAFAKGPFPSVLELEVNGDAAIPVAIQAFPSITSFKSMTDMTQVNADLVLTRCRNLRHLTIRGIGVFPLALDRLATANCSSLLTKLHLPPLAAGAVTVLCRCCPNITDLATHYLPARDIAELSSLKCLEKFRISMPNGFQGIEFSDAFRALGQSVGAAPFKKLTFYDGRFDAIPFFSSRRCSTLRDLTFTLCDFPEGSVRALAANASCSLKALSFSTERMSTMLHLLSACHELERLEIFFLIPDVTFDQIAKSINSLVSVAKFGAVTEECARALAPVLRNVEELEMRCRDDALLEVVSGCPRLKRLCVNDPWIRDKIRPHVSSQIELL